MFDFGAFTHFVEMPKDILMAKGKTTQTTLKNLGNALFIFFLSLLIISGTNAQVKRKTQRTKEVQSVTIQKQILVPADSELQSLIKATIADFATGVEKGDFTDFYARTSDDFQHSISLSEFNNKFKPFIEQKHAFMPILNSTNATDATFSTAPEIRTIEYGNKILALKGDVKAQNNFVNFDTEYKWETNKWKLVKIKVGLSQL
jgi:hypothetical protein